MDNNVFNQYLTDITPIEDASEDTESIKGIYKVGETPVKIMIEMKKQEDVEIVGFKADSTYNFEVLAANCESFNKEVIEKYGTTYNIYGHLNTLYLSKKQVVEPDYGLEMICEEVFSILEDVVKLFEKNCVNFMNKYTKNDVIHTLDPELKKGDFEDKIAYTEDNSVLTTSFLDNHRTYAESKLTRLAEKYSATIISSDADNLYFETALEEGNLKLQLGTDSTDFDISFSKEMPESKGFALVSNVIATYPEYFTTYENGKVIIRNFVTPDEFLPELEEEEICKIIDAFKTCDQLTIEEASHPGMDVAASDLRQIMNEQLMQLKDKETKLDEKEAFLKETEEKLHEKAILFEEEKKRQISFIQEKIQSLKEREKAVNILKNELEQQKNSHEKEKNQYDIQFENMVAELKRMRARVDNSGLSEDSEEKRKLELKIKAMTRSRAAMEDQLKKELGNIQEKYRQLLRDLQLKDKEIMDMKNDFKIKANQMFQEERDDYEKRIHELQEVANITENDVNIDSFHTYLNEKTEFSNAIIQHARDKELISLSYESYLIKIVFGDTLFVDVTKGFRKAVDLKTVSNMNNTYTDIKFFVNDKKTVTARKYFSKHILNPDLTQVIRDLMSNFD